MRQVAFFLYWNHTLRDKTAHKYINIDDSE
jgi:hypothetical protein